MVVEGNCIYAANIGTFKLLMLNDAGIYRSYAQPHKQLLSLKVHPSDIAAVLVSEGVYDHIPRK